MTNLTAGDAGDGSNISVCLLTYNHVHLIRSTVASILEQNLPRFELIISDDCSTDGTWECILEMAARDARIRPLQPPTNQGMPGNANFAVAHSSRPYIALLHHDDIYRQDLLDLWSGVLDRHPGAAFVFNPYGVHGSKDFQREPLPGECIDGHWLLDNYLLPRWGCLIRGTAMIRRDIWNQVGGMRLQYGLLSDVDLWMRLAARWQVGYVDERIMELRQERPEDYPDAYKATRWSWPRKRFLYEIHAQNRLDYWNLGSPVGRLKWWGFRVKLSLETAKWLSYAVVRKRPEMISESDKSATPYDLWPVRLYRSLLRALYRR
ncbi:glycosyltransferase family A protein [Ideonella sp. DXS22W]|uniref:Glycosyltransferase family A protein n=1 Tax=Pseudaquabacterium inlustre TaxID=2984192 RepID=A0ABU9CDD7_9BURK